MSRLEPRREGSRSPVSSKPPMRFWPTASRWAPIVIAACAAVLIAVGKAALTRVQTGQWDGYELARDLFGNVIIAVVAGGVLLLAQQRADEAAARAYVSHTTMLMRTAVLAWTSPPQYAAATVGSREALNLLDKARATLADIDAGLALLTGGGSGGDEVRAGVFLDQLRRYVQGGGRARRKVYAQSLLSELSTVRAGNNSSLSTASTRFVYHTTDWLGLMVRTDAAATALAYEGSERSASPTGRTPTLDVAVLADSLGTGEDPGVGVRRALANLEARGMERAPAAEIVLLRALRTEVQAAAACVGDLASLAELVHAAEPRGADVTA